MSYTPTIWIDGQTPVNAENMSKLENGVAANSNAIDKMNQDFSQNADAVRYTVQELTAEQQAQARENIGTVSSKSYYLTKDMPSCLVSSVGRTTVGYQGIGQTLRFDPTNWYCYFIIAVEPGEVYQLTLRTNGTGYHHVFFADENLVILGRDLQGGSELTEIKGYEVVIPEGCTRLVMQSQSASNLNSAYNKIKKVSSLASKVDVADTMDSHIEEYHTPVTDYLRTNITSAVSSLTRRSGNALSIAFLTDLHYLAFSGDRSVYDNIFSRCTKAIQEIDKKKAIDFVILGADYLWNNTGTNYDEAVYAYEHMQECFYPLRDKLFALKGNHDDNSIVFTGTEYNSAEHVIHDDLRYSYLGQQYTKDVVTNYGNAEKSYGYIDFKRQKVRCIFVNTSDIPYIYDDGVMRHVGISDSAVSNDQLNFVAKALKFDEPDWAVLFFSHHPLKNIAGYGGNLASNHGGNALWGIITAYKNKDSFSITSALADFEYAVSVDYSDNKSNDVVACICGHIHRDADSIVDGIRMVATTACGYGQGAYDSTGAAITWEYESISETAFDIFSIDRLNRKLYAVRFGAGQDREMSF